jgi:MFS family permease
MIAAMLGTILPELSERFHLTPRQNGTIAFGQALGLMIASVGVGPLIDNQGKKVGLILGLVLIAIVLASLPRSRGFGSIVVLLFVLGLGGGIVVTGANALVSDVAEARRGTALNLVNLFFGLGGMATPFISANLLKRDTVKLCYVAGAFAVIALLVQAAAPIPGPTGAQSFVLSDAGVVLGRPILFLLGAFPVPLCELRSRHLELACAASRRTRHSGSSRAKRPVAGVWARDPSGPRSGFPDPDKRTCGDRHVSSRDGDGGDYVVSSPRAQGG